MTETETMVGVHHVSFTVSKLERAVAFYRDILGMEMILQQDASSEYVKKIVAFPNAYLRQAFLKLPGQSHICLELIEYEEPKGTPVDMKTCNPGSAHLCFIVDDLLKVYDDLKSKNVRFKSEPVTIDAGTNRGAHAVYFLDPDDITLELLQPPK